MLISHVLVVPLAGIGCNLSQGRVESLVLRQIKLAIAVGVGLGPGIGHLLHLLRLEVLVGLELLQLLKSSVFLVLGGRVLPTFELGCGQLVDPRDECFGEGGSCFCHLL